MSQNRKEFLFSKLNLKFIPQVSLLVGNKNSFNLIIDAFLKKIICQEQFCSDEFLCHDCKKIANKCYFDLNWYKLNKSSILKKQDASNIIRTLMYQSLEENKPKICIIEDIEHSSLEASNIFLKFLENLPEKVFLIFTSLNSESVLSTIQSRCQIINLNNFKLSNNLDSIFNLENDSKLEVIKEVTRKFVTYDNNKDYDSNFFLIKELVSLEDKLLLFFQFLLNLAEKKLISLKFENFVENNNQLVDDYLLKTWKNNNQSFLIKFIELLNETINKFSDTKNLNLNLALNYFFISLYQG